jgi:hypothetical protein
MMRKIINYEGKHLTVHYERAVYRILRKNIQSIGEPSLKFLNFKKAGAGFVAKGSLFLGPLQLLNREKWL